jgi:hypothetical protein
MFLMVDYAGYLVQNVIEVIRIISLTTTIDLCMFAVIPT